MKRYCAGSCSPSSVLAPRANFLSPARSRGRMSLPNEEFQRRYGLTSSTGRVFTLDMIVRLAHLMCDGTGMPLVRMHVLMRHEVVAVLNDDSFMRPRTGVSPWRVADDCVQEALRRREAARRLLPWCAECAKSVAHAPGLVGHLLGCSIRRHVRLRQQRRRVVLGRTTHVSSVA